MPKLLAFSDVHAHPFPYGAGFASFQGYMGNHNSRLVSTVEAIKHVGEVADAQGIRYVLFGGDLFHTRQSVKTAALNMVAYAIRRYFSDREINLIMIPGNHDYADRVGHVHSLQVLAQLPFVHVLDGDPLSHFVTKDLVVSGAPYSDDMHETKKRLDIAAEVSRGHRKTNPDRPTILLGHCGIQGGKVGSDYVLVSDMDIKSTDIPFDAFDLCLFGHYHQHQTIDKNAYYIGALTEHNWSDTGGKRGYLTIDTGAVPTMSGGCISLARTETDAPKFVTCKSKKDLEKARSVDFVTYYTDKTLTSEQQAELRELSKTDTFEIKPVKTDEEKTIELAIDNLDPTTALEPWVKAHGGDLDEKKLLKMGKDLFGKAQGSV